MDAGELALIGAGAGSSVEAIIKNILSVGLDPRKISTIILTHCHIDHVGGAREIRKRFGSRVIMHESDALAVERGDTGLTGASWYGVDFEPLPVDVKLTQHEETLHVGTQKMVCLHTPGHTPGSISVYLDKGGKRVLFGQDIHGPFLKEFGADMVQWRQSMEELLSLEADVLCEGHFGVYQPADKVAGYIERYLDEYGE